MKTETTERWVVCRICLQESENMYDIFNTHQHGNLPEMLRECVGLPLNVGDTFPEKICVLCLRQLRLSYKFRRNAHRSHQQILELLGSQAIMMEDHSDLTDAQKLHETGGMFIGEQFVENEHIPKAECIKIEQIDTDTNSSSPVEAEVIQYDDEINFEAYEHNGSADAEIPQTAETEDDDGYTEYAEYAEYEIVEDEAYLDDSATKTSNYEEEITSATVEEFDNIEAQIIDDDINEDILTSDEEYLPNQKQRSAAASKRSKQIRQHASQLARTTTTPNTHLTLPSTTKQRTRTSKKDKLMTYICDVCGNIYPTQARLTEHMKFHSGIKPHECEICGRGFVQNQQLVRHMNTHTGNRPYKCNYCPAAFADRSTKTKHHRIHTKERPYECDVCGKTFTYSDNLKFHKMIHTGEKPHVCDICGKGFTKAYKMRLHRTTHEKRGLIPTTQVKSEIIIG